MGNHLQLKTIATMQGRTLLQETEEALHVASRELKQANATIESLRGELHFVKFANTVLKEENERLSALYQIRKSLEPLAQGCTDSRPPSPKSPVSPRLSRDEYNWGTIIKMYEKQVHTLRAERDSLRSGV